MFVVLLFLMITVDNGCAVLYSLNQSTYSRMPPLFHLDDYEKCLNEPDGLYCSVEFHLVSDTRSELLTIIQEYSQHEVRHFNHTKPYYGLCVTQTCQQYMQDTKAGLTKVLEGCLNESISKEYDLKTRVFDYYQCTSSNESMEINIGDIVVVAVIVIIIIINLIASLYDMLYIRGKDKDGNKYLINFSIPKNLNKLVDVSSRPNPRQDRLRCLDALKAMSISLVIVGHSLLPLAVLCQNVYFLEKTQHNIFYEVLYNGTVIVQLFFLISGLLLSYNLQITSETIALHWVEIPKRIGIRWLRLTPPYAVVLAITATWLRHAGSGPFWKRIVNEAVRDCNQHWWTHLTYINNYYDNGLCMPHVWYVAADLHLHIVGLIVCIMFKGLVRKLILALLFVIGIVAPALHTYLQDLNGTLLLTFEAVRTLFVTDPTFVYVYTPTHTNMTCFIMGLGLGLLIYHLQNNNFDIQKYKKLQPLVYALIPLNIGVILVGMVGYRDAPRLNIYVRVLFAAIIKPLFGGVFALLIFAMVFKLEKPLRGFLEAKVWTVLCRISYSAFLSHEIIFRSLTGTGILLRSDVIHLFNITLGNVVISFILGFILWLLVESPFLGIIDTLRSRNTKRKETKNGNENEAKEVIEANTLL